MILHGILLLVTASAQFVPDNEDYEDDMSFLEIAETGGENAWLCVCIEE